jgi:hypothetical protein
VAGWFTSEASAAPAAASYQRQAQLLHQDVKQARAQGYTSQDLAPVPGRLQQIEQSGAPLLVIGRESFYKQQGAAVAQLRGQLRGQLVEATGDARAGAVQQIVAARQGLDRALQVGVTDAELQPLRVQLDALDQQRAAAKTIASIRDATGKVQQVVAAGQRLVAAQEQENQALQQAAADLQAKAQGDIEGLRAQARQAIASARNDATVATWLRIAGWDAAYQRLERVAPMVEAPEIGKVALAAAAGQRYGGQVHDTMLRGMPKKAIVMSISGQQLWAYEGSRVVQDTLVTSGRPPDLATDVGPMKVLRRNSPWEMKSPWPKDSPFYYPPAVVQQVIWFTVTGEGFHDAPWQNTPYGPGSQFGPNASHGCVHVPPPSERFLYDWADAGTPVIAFPGDGTPLADQLKQKTVNDDGVPFTGPKGA